MPQYSGPLTPLGGGGDYGWQLVRGRDISIPSSLVVESFETSNGGTKTKVNIADHRFQVGDSINFVEYTGTDNLYTGEQTIDSKSDNYFIINTSYQGNRSGYRAAPPPLSSINNDDTFLVDDGNTGDQSKTRYAKASVLKNYLQTSPYADNTRVYFGTDNDFSFGFDSNESLFKLYNGNNVVFSVSPTEGTLTFPALGSAPTATVGSIYYDGADFYLCRN